jgi:hypothetical protein
MWCRSDARLWPAIIYYFLTRRHSDTRVVSFYLSFGFREDYRPTSILYFQCIHIFFQLHFCWNTHMHSCWHLLYLKSELSCEYIQSTHLACWFGQMWTKAISWMKSSIASPTLRGVPVSLLRSWSWSLFYNRFRLPPNKFIGSHSDTRWTVKYWSHTTHFTVTYSTAFYYESVVCHPALCHIRLYVIYWRACNKIRWAIPSSTLYNIQCTGNSVSRNCLPAGILFLAGLIKRPVFR